MPRLLLLLHSSAHRIPGQHHRVCHKHRNHTPLAPSELTHRPHKAMGHRDGGRVIEEPSPADARGLPGAGLGGGGGGYPSQLWGWAVPKIMFPSKSGQWESCTRANLRKKWRGTSLLIGSYPVLTEDLDSAVGHPPPPFCWSWAKRRLRRVAGGPGLVHRRHTPPPVLLVPPLTGLSPPPTLRQSLLQTLQPDHFLAPPPPPERRRR